MLAVSGDPDGYGRPPKEATMMRRSLFLVAMSLVISAPAFGQSRDERQWLAEHPEALQALGALPREDLGRFLEAYQKLPPAEQEKLREHAEELRGLSSEERRWALEHPDAVRQLGNLPEDDRQQMFDAYRGLSPDAQRFIRDRMTGR